jgi:hypothetical protein
MIAPVHLGSLYAQLPLRLSCILREEAVLPGLLNPLIVRPSVTPF